MTCIMIEDGMFPESRDRAITYVHRNSIDVFLLLFYVYISLYRGPCVFVNLMLSVISLVNK